jgi:hypothetical protein
VQQNFSLPGGNGTHEVHFTSHCFQLTVQLITVGRANIAMQDN